MRLLPSGGGATIKGLDQQLKRCDRLPVVIADDPPSAVANGTGLVLNELAFLLKDLTGNPNSTRRGETPPR